MEHLLKEYLKTMEKDDKKWRKLAKACGVPLTHEEYEGQKKSFRK
jgi:hypothetical protein